MSSSKPTVAVARYDETDGSLRKAIELCKGFENLKADHRVLLKPNITWGGGGSKKLPKFGVLTTTRIIEDLIVMLREQGCRHIAIGEGSLVSAELGSSTRSGYRWAGISRVAKKHDVQLIDFNGGHFSKVKIGGVEIGLADSALEADFFINLPVLKTHSQTKVSLGLKNLKGCLSLRSRMDFHRGDLESMIASLATQIQPDLTIIDGIYAMERGPLMNGTAHRADLIIAGRDPLACDVVGSSILGIDPASVDHLRECARSTGRSLDLTGIDVRGEKIEEVCTNLEWQLHDLADIPQKAGIQGLTVPFPGNHFCTGCVANLGALLLMFSVDNPGVTLDNTEICCGAEVQARKESKKVFLFGNCAIGANRGLDRGIALEGCPPKVADSLVTVLNDTVGKSRARKILMSRLLKVIGFKMGIYNEVYQVINRYEYPSFDERHFQVAR